jgi:cysteinyl-tRNA synthetase
MGRLGPALRPDIEPRATETIAEIIDLCCSLIDRGHAYVAKDGSVYFKVCTCADYGKLNHIDFSKLETQSENSAGEANDADEYERESASDFALWKSRKPEDGANFWPSPWGEGRPGWHIECSAMSLAHLGATFDLHGGGIDLCFPHHENEIAQSECATGVKGFAAHWFHSAHLMVEGEKMSKSLGNLYTLDDLRAKGFSPMVVRYTLIAGSYRQQLNFTFDGLHASQSALSKLERFADSLLAKTGESTEAFNASYVSAQAPADFGRLSKAWDALRHNLNTAACLGAIFGVIGSNPAASLDADGARALLRAFGSLLYALGLQLFTVEAKPVDALAGIVALAQARWDAKQAKDWTKADALRDELLEKGWTVKDSKDGFELEPK